MTVETASITAPVPPKKREYPEYPVSSPAMSDTESPAVSPGAVKTAPSSPAPDPSQDSLSPVSSLHAAITASKTAPLRSSGFMITDILSGASAGLSPLSLLPQASLQSQFQRIPSPHDSDSSDTGSNNNHDISDEGEDGEFENDVTKSTSRDNASIEWWLELVMLQTELSIFFLGK